LTLRRALTCGWLETSRLMRSGFLPAALCSSLASHPRSYPTLSPGGLTLSSWSTLCSYELKLPEKETGHQHNALSCPPFSLISRQMGQRSQRMERLLLDEHELRRRKRRDQRQAGREGGRSSQQASERGGGRADSYVTVIESDPILHIFCTAEARCSKMVRSSFLSSSSP
jgi:hypothetical protein